MDSFVQVAALAELRLEDFTARGLSMLAHAYATVGHGVPGALELLRGVGTQVAGRAGEFTAHELALTMWSMAVVGALRGVEGRRAVDATAAALPFLELNTIDEVRAVPADGC